jgi:hypothetical protein
MALATCGILVNIEVLSSRSFAAIRCLMVLGYEADIIKTRLRLACFLGDSSR